MSVRIVNDLEVIKVYHQTCQFTAVTPRFRMFSGQGTLQTKAVVKTSQRIGHRPFLSCLCISECYLSNALQRIAFTFQSQSDAYTCDQFLSFKWLCDKVGCAERKTVDHHFGFITPR